jgi:hypothetical protein
MGTKRNERNDWKESRREAGVGAIYRPAEMMKR